ncbi:MAG: hypothetical protein ABSG78_13795 [Verrucomicrobiota bacterium]|jgi:hypothetical protein
MKIDKKCGAGRAWLCRAGFAGTQRDRLAQAGYPRFLFRLAAARRAWAGAGAEPRRHD